MAARSSATRAEGSSATGMGIWADLTQRPYGLAVKTDQVVRWAVRALWVALPFTVGGVLGDALSAGSRPVQVVATAGLWLAWAVGMVATAVALPVSLTALRVLAPAAVAAALA